MKTFYNKILSICLSFFVLFSTASFSVEMHYCCDTLIDIGVFVQAETCRSESQKGERVSCEDSDESCCHNSQIDKFGQNDLKTSYNDYSNYVLKIFSGINTSYFDLFLDVKVDSSTNNDYRPPLRLRDITIFYETFLI